MFERAGPYWSVFLINLKDSFAYRTDILLTAIFSLATAAIMIIVWTFVYASSNESTIMGVSLTTLYVYFLFVSGFRAIFDTNIPGTIQEDITSGNIAVTMTRPIRYLDQVLLKCFGATVSDSLLVGLPLILIGLFFLHSVIAYSTVGIFAIELVIGYVITTSIETMLGCCAIYMTQIWSLVSINWMLTYLLGGGVVPLLFLPSWVGVIVNLLPFKYILYVPTATLLGIGNIDIVSTIALGLAWCVILLAGAAFMWSKVKKSVSAVGG